MFVSTLITTNKHSSAMDHICKVSSFDNVMNDVNTKLKIFPNSGCSLIFFFCYYDI